MTLLLPIAQAAQLLEVFVLKVHNLIFVSLPQTADIQLSHKPIEITRIRSVNACSPLDRLTNNKVSAIDISGRSSDHAN